MIEIGRIVNRHGVRGEVRLVLHNPDSALLDQLPVLCLRAADGAIESRRVLGRRRHKRFVLLQLEGVATANDAEALIGRAVCVDRAQLPPTEPGEAYHLDIVGCAVRTESGEPVGVVREVFRTGSNDVCVVEGDRGEHLIPLIADVIVRFDVPAREIVIRPIPGLLE